MNILASIIWDGGATIAPLFPLAADGETFGIRFAKKTQIFEQADVIFSVVQEVVNGAPVTLDLQAGTGGSLTGKDADGETINLAKIYAIMLHNRGSSAGSMRVESQQAFGFFSGTGDEVTLPPDGYLMIGVDAGPALVAASADIILYSSYGTSTLELIVIGKSV